MPKNSLRDSQDTLKRMDIKDTTRCWESQGVAVGRMFVGTSLKRCLRAKSTTTVIRLCRGFNSAINYFNMRNPIKKEFSYEKRKEMRLKQEKPVLDAFWSWLDNQHPVRNSRLDKAVTYVQNRRQFLETYLKDGRCSFSNNLSENAIRPFTLGRKNWLFSKSQDGAEASATVYSIVEMAKAHELAPWIQNAIDNCHN